MKKHLLSLLTLLLALLLLAGCANHGKTLFKVKGEEISVNVFQLYLSRMKGQLASAGENVNSHAYWEKIYSIEGPVTYADYYTDRVFEGLRQQAAALYFHNELGLELPKEEIEAIDDWIDGLIEEVGGGSKSMLNSTLSAYGANITVLRDAAILEAKMQQLKEYRYGEEGSALSSKAKEEFYQKTYYRGYQMLLSNTYYDHEKDGDGNAVYYKTDGKIAYDTVNGVATDQLDKNQEAIYRLPLEGGGFGDIAYDKKNGTMKFLYNENGERITKEYTDEQMQERRDVLEAIAETCKGKPELFLQYAAEFSDNSAFNEEFAPNGMYFSAGTYTSDTIFYTFATELAELEEGELAILDSSSGFYLIMRVPIDEGAWAKEENARWFSTLSTLAVEYVLQQEIAPYLQYVTVDEALKKTVDITMVAANNYY